MNSAFERFESASALEAYLIDEAVGRYTTLFGQPAYGGGYWPVLYDYGLSSELAVEAAPAVLSDVAFADTTNTQVDGVDEADLIETDGEFLYQVSGQTVTIVDAKEPSDLAIASQFSLAPLWNLQNSGAATPTSVDASSASIPVEPFFPIGGPVGGWSNIDGMYLQGDRLTIIASGYVTSQPSSSTQSLVYPGLPSSPKVQVTVLDVADPTQVSILETSILDGNLISSRAIGDEVVVVTRDGFQLPAPLVIEQEENSRIVVEKTEQAITRDIAPYYPYPYPYPEPTGVYETKDAYVERIRGQAIDLVLPRVETYSGPGEVVASSVLNPATEIYQPLSKTPLPQLTTVSTFDVGDGNRGVDASVSLPTSWVQQVFVSQDSLYLLKPNYDGGKVSTDITKLDLETSELIAVGQVPGRIDSQFSADEHDGFLRISTTTNFGAASLNNVYVLEQNDHSLDVVGKVEGLAPGERIFSTRFQGDYGFIVTFRQVDPLFALDLRDPTNPKVAGELKIPGFSEYLQVIQQGDQTLLLGVGRDADPLTGRAQALKVSLFDVTDLGNPIELDNYIFDGDYSSSEALWNHRAVTYVPEQQLLAIPNREYDESFYSSRTQLSVFRVDGETGLTALGEVEHGGGAINRSVSIEETLYAFSQRQISAYGMGDLTPLDAVTWSTEGVAPLGWRSSGDAFLSSSFLDADRSGITIAPNPASELLPGTPNDDAIAGGAGDDKLYGNGGRDVFSGSEGNDEIAGGGGRDIAFGGAGDDTIYGNDARDILLGNEGDDILMGGNGDDLLVGGAGGDRLTGGSGSDVFAYGRGSESIERERIGTDIIEDFQVGIDQIGLLEGSLLEADVTLVQEGRHTVLGAVNGEERLAVLKYVRLEDLDQSSFVTVANVFNVEQAMAQL